MNHSGVIDFKKYISKNPKISRFVSCQMFSWGGPHFYMFALTYKSKKMKTLKIFFEHYPSHFEPQLSDPIYFKSPALGYQTRFILLQTSSYNKFSL